MEHPGTETKINWDVVFKVGDVNEDKKLSLEELENALLIGEMKALQKASR